MKDIMARYITGCFHMIPAGGYIGMFVVFLIGTIVLSSLLGVKKGTKWSVRLLLLEFLFWIIAMAILFRPLMSERHLFLTPFRFIHAIRQGNYQALTEDIMNVAVFVPVGFLLGCGFGRLKWWKVLLIGGSFSVFIETLQFFSRRGFAEVDDVVYNVVGCMIGYGVYVGIAYLVKVIRKRRVVEDAMEK